MDVTLEQVLVAARERKAPVTPETAGYIALAIGDALIAAPAVVRETEVRFSEDGSVAVVGAHRAADAAAAERSVRVLLGKLMHVAAGSAPALSACARNHGGAGVDALVKELEAALVPVNRSAARRAIGRLAREAARTADAGSTRPAAERPKTASAPEAKPGGRAERPAQAVEPQVERAAAPRPAPAVVPGPASARAAVSAQNKISSGVLEAASEPEYTRPVRPAPSAPAAAASRSPTPSPAAMFVADPTEIDAPVAQITPPPPTPEPLAPVVPIVAAESLAHTPKLTTYDPSSSQAAAASQAILRPSAESPVEPVASEPVVPVFDDASRPIVTSAPAPDEALRPVVVSAPISDDASRPLVISAPAYGEVTEADIPTPSVAIDVEPRDEADTAGVGSQGSEQAEDGKDPARDAQMGSELSEAVHEQPQALSPEDQHEQPRVPAEAQAATSSEIAPLTEADRPAEPAHEADAPQPEEAKPATAEAVKAERARDASEHDAKPDRVGELLSTFGASRERSSREVAGELKNMLGLAPTPPPPMVESVSSDTPGASAARLVSGHESSDDAGVMPPVEFARPRASRGGFVVVVMLLVLALGALAALWYFRPEVFLGH